MGAVAVLGTQTINNRIIEVNFELGNRGDLTSRSPSRLALWMRNAYISLCQSYDFEGLEFSITSQLSNASQLGWQPDARAIKSMIITGPGGDISFPDHKDIQTIRRSQVTLSPGKPSMYCVFNNNILF